MKQLLWGSALAVLVAACGGTSAPPPAEPEPAKSACAVAAENVAKVIVEAKVRDVTAEKGPTVIRVITERCEADTWSDETVACMTTMTSAETDLERCGDSLTDTQRDAVEAQMDREVLGEDDAAAPPPPPDDPCGGGA